MPRSTGVVAPMPHGPAAVVWGLWHTCPDLRGLWPPCPTGRPRPFGGCATHAPIRDSTLMHHGRHDQDAPFARVTPGQPMSARVAGVARLRRSRYGCGDRVYLVLFELKLGRHRSEEGCPE